MLQILDVALGLILVFTLVSFTVSLVTEWISAFWGQRSHLLRKGLLQMLGKDKGDAVCDHPLVQSLIPRKWLANRHGPSYIPTDIFVATLLAVLDPGGKGATSPSGFQAHLERLPADNALRQALLPLVEQAGTDWKRLKKSLGEWFDRVMDEVTAWYRRWSQIVLFVAGTLLAAVVGVDAIDITRSLWVDEEIRAGISAIAVDVATENPLGIGDGAASQDPQGQPAPANAGDSKTLEERTEELRQLRRQLAKVGLPLRPITQCPWGPELPWCVFGYLLTGVAASLGAGFWFDLLKRLVQIRTAVPPQGAVATGASEDREDEG